MVLIREAGPSDRSAILELVSRVSEFGPPAWRDGAQVQAHDRAVLDSALGSTAEDVLILVATAGADVVGFAHITTVKDYYTQKANAHVADIAVASQWAGQGIGTRLLDRAEAWAIARGDDWLSLSVFPQNAHAVRLYERYGFEPDIARYLKPLGQK